jgi:hypothetical protein
MCIIHLIRCASWSHDAEDEPSRPQDVVKRELLWKVMLRDEPKDGWPDQEPWWRWSSSDCRLTNTNLVLFQASPDAFSLSLCFKIFITLYDALGDRSCVINNWCISFLGKLIINPWYPFMKRIFIMLSLALEKTKCFFKQKVMLHTGWGFLQKKDWWWWIHHDRDGFNIWKKKYLCQVQNFGF